MSTPRYELKYWCSPEQLADVLAGLEGLLERDPKAPDGGRYLVTSLYFDTPERSAFVDKIEGVRRREKVRLRRYGTAQEGWAELKAKRGRRVRKYRVALDPEALKALAEGDDRELQERAAASDEAAKRLLGAAGRRSLTPAVITRYEREAWRLVDDPLVRLTVDRGIVGVGDDLVASFLAADPEVLSGAPLADAGSRAPWVLELKVSGPVPAEVARVLRGASLRRQSISKYCLALSRTGNTPERLARAAEFFLGSPADR